MPLTVSMREVEVLV